MTQVRSDSIEASVNSYIGPWGRVGLLFPMWLAHDFLAPGIFAKVRRYFGVARQ